MPLNRDQQARPEKSRSVADYTTNKQHQRTAGLSLVDADRPATPQNGADVRSRSRTRRDDVSGGKNGVPAASGKYALDLEHENNNVNLYQPQKLKVAVPNTMDPSRSTTQHVAATSQPKVQSKQRKPDVSHREEDQRQAQKPSVFDDTTSIGPSMLEDSNLEDNVTAVHNPQPAPPRQRQPHVPYEAIHPDEDFGGNFGTQEVLEQLGVGPNWQQELAEERAYHAEKAGYVPTPQRDVNPFNATGTQKIVGPRRAFEGLPDQPETPTRVQSVPPHNGKMHAPVAKRAVGFANSPEFFSDSPAFRSEEIAREDSPAMSLSRPNSAQLPYHSMPTHQRPQQLQPNLHTRQQQVQPSQAPQPNRHQRFEDLRNRVVQQEQKVSAPDSDMQDSEDERAARTQFENTRAATIQVDEAPLTNKKRPFEDINILDYDADVLTRKSLAELQKEPYEKSPRMPDKTPAIDSNGNEMTLPQVLENLSRMAPEQQQATFSTLTDEEWAHTGQWFVDKFQTDLKKLMEVRLKRRQIALTFEDRIRRRQRQVEYQQAGVEKQLKELQEGGTGLLRDRPATGGSRSGTPLRTPRGPAR